jgi:PAS domain S-box-containing protein
MSTPRRNVDAEAIVHSHLVGEAMRAGGHVVLVADEAMRFLAASESACALLGYTRRELVELAVTDVVVDQDAGLRYGEFVRSREQRGRITLKRKDRTTVTAYYDAHRARVGDVTYYVSVLIPLEE